MCWLPVLNFSFLVFIADVLPRGSVKSNIGHLEGCSALAGIIKAIMVLEKGVIVPNALFENVNPKIDLEWLKCAVRNFPIIMLSNRC